MSYWKLVRLHTVTHILHHCSKKIKKKKCLVKDDFTRNTSVKDRYCNTGGKKLGFKARA